MSNAFRITLSLLALFLVFRVGFKKAVNKSKQRALASRNVTEDPLTPMIMGPAVAPARNSIFRINGLPTKIDMYTVRGSVEKELATYESGLRAKGYEPLIKSIGRIKMISNYDFNRKFFETRIILPDPMTGKTMVIPAKIDLSKPPREGRYRTPVPPKAQTLFHLESDDFAGYSENLILLSDARVDGVMDFYTRKLTRAGWRIAQQPPASFDHRSAEMRLFVNGTDECWVSASKIEGQDKSVVFLLYNDKD